MKSFKLDQIQDVAKLIFEKTSGKVFLFHGEMGVGKTTLIKEMMLRLGVQDSVSSPTFSLVNEYQSNLGNPIYHFDFYRIETEKEALDIGVEDYFYSGDMCFVEWPEKVKNLVPLDAIEIRLSLNSDGSRTILIN